MSYFMHGWNWSKHQQLVVEAILLNALTSNHDPDPAKASNPQYEQQRYRLEFQVHTLTMPPDICVSQAAGDDLPCTMMCLSRTK